MTNIVNNVSVFGLEDTFKACQYSFATDVNEITPNEKPLLNCSKTPIGSGHDNALMGIVVEFDLTFTNKAWVEMERYHFADIVMSQSTMHKITKFDLDNAYNEYVSPDSIQLVKDLVDAYNTVDDWWGDKDTRMVRDLYTFYAETISKEDWKNRQYLRILYSNPAGMLLTARMVTNYRQLRTIYHQRKNHRLPEWREFCAWIESLPRAKELILND